MSRLWGMVRGTVLECVKAVQECEGHSIARGQPHPKGRQGTSEED